MNARAILRVFADRLTRHFAKAGLWVSSRKDIIYEIETDEAFIGKIYGLYLEAPIKEALKSTDLYFYRSDANNARLMVSDTLSPLKVEITLDPKFEKIKKLKLTDYSIAGGWVREGDVIMRRLEKKPGK